MYSFTAAEARCAVLLRDGASLHEIADKLTLSLATIRTHLSHMLHKCGVSRQGALIARLRQDLWLFTPRGDASAD